MSEPVNPTELPEFLATLSFEHRKDQDAWLRGNQAAQNAFWGATKILSSLKAGEVDPWLGLKIDTIIRKSTRYIIYLDTDLDVQWFWLTQPDELAVGLVQARIGQLTKESSFLLVGRGNPLTVSLSDRYLAKKIRSVMGEALALALNGSSEADCEAVLDEAKRYIAVAKDERTRPMFVSFFLLTVGLFGGVLGAWVCWLAACCVKQVDHRFVTGWLEAAVAGGAGALISALLRTRDLGLEPAAGIKGIAVEAIARALIGAGSGVLVSFAFDSGILLKGAIQDPATARILRLFFCVASGVSERMLPALVGRAESLTGSVAGDTGSQSGNGNSTQSPKTASGPGGLGGDGAPAQSKTQSTPPLGDQVNAGPQEPQGTQPPTGQSTG
jgi:hypothetical protein